MRVSLTAMKMAIDPNVGNIVFGLLRDNSRRAIGATPTAVTDNSTGVAGAAIVPVNLPGKFAYTSGTTLAGRTTFNTAIAKVDNAIAVLAKHLGDNGLVKIGEGNVTKNSTSVIAVAGTVPALDNVVTGVDGSGNSALLRSEANAAISVLRNNLSSLVRAYNFVATAIGVPTLADNTGGKASLTNFVFAEQTSAATGAGNAADVVSKAEVDAALAALANDIAYVAARVNASVFAAASLVPNTTRLVP